MGASGEFVRTDDFHWKSGKIGEIERKDVIQLMDEEYCRQSDIVCSLSLNSNF